MALAQATPAAPHCSAAETETKVFRVYIMQQPAGVATVRNTPDGVQHSCFEFNDRGRGPFLETTIKFSDVGLPVALETTGHDYLKAPVNEKFTLDGRTARWKNTAEQGKKNLSADAFYVPLSEDQVPFFALAQALARAPAGRLPLLPEGEASITQVDDLQLTANGQTRTVTQYTISGIDFSPDPVWLNPDGSVFAVVQVWFQIIPEEWQSAIPQLLKAQAAASAARMKAIAEKFAHKPAGPLAIEHANLFDAESLKSLPNTTVLIKGNRIEAVGPDGEVAIPSGAQKIDAAGKALLPGLWDMHVHVGENDGILHMAAGVTSVRDLGNDIDKTLESRKQFRVGSAIGPRIVLAGIMDGPGPYQGPTKVLVANEQQARAAVDRYAELGYEQIKIYSSIKPELVPAIVDEAHKQKLRVSGHIPALMTAEQAIRDGYDEVQHINFFFLNFLFDKVQDTRTPARFTTVGQYGADIKPKSQPVQNFIRLLKQHHTVWDPTLVAFEDMFLARPGQMDVSFAPVADRLPVQLQRGLRTGGLPVTSATDQRYRDSWANMVRMVGELWRDGVTIVAGTDATAGFGLHRELELYVQAGIPAPNVLQIATLGAARVMHYDAELGSIAPGKLADVVLVDGDPARNISDIRRVSTVVKDGVVFRPSELYPVLGVKPSRPARLPTSAL
jgi:imidazolonepropionase-like amidohydrolase